MTADLKPYRSMKPSGVPWLGVVPEHWEIRRVKQYFREKDHRNGGENNELLSLTRANGLIPQSEASGRPASAADLSRYKICVPSDLVMNRMQAWSGMFALSSRTGAVSPDYAVFGAVRPVDAKYFEHLFKTPLLVEQFALRSRGIGSGFNRLYTPDFGAVPIAVPPLTEQTAIVRYLDQLDRRIRRYIRAKQKMIELLEEQKQAVIHRAVTRGMDANVRLKPAGVPSLGEVPEHWDMVPNRSLLRLKKRVVGSSWSDYPLLSLTKRGVILRNLENLEGKFPTSFDTYQEVNPGDMVFCLFDIDETPRAVGLSPLHGMITSAYTTFSCDPETVDWVHWFYLAMDNGKHLKPLYTGLRKVITRSAFLSAKMPLPPRAEQTAIVRYLDDATSNTRTLIERTNREVQLLRELRSRLVSDVVTGKLDVREAAAKLPIEAEESEPADDTDLLVAVDEVAADELDAPPEEAEF
jgi:type I restriction enzyme S subunit